jgi:hypothetical protein
VPGAGDFRGGEERRAEVGARSAHPELTRRACLSAVSAANATSCAARPRTEYRSAVAAQLRPPRHEPAPGTACREAQHREEQHREAQHRDVPHREAQHREAQHRDAPHSDALHRTAMCRARPRRGTP